MRILIGRQWTFVRNDETQHNETYPYCKVISASQALSFVKKDFASCLGALTKRALRERTQVSSLDDWNLQLSRKSVAERGYLQFNVVYFVIPVDRDSSCVGYLQFAWLNQNNGTRAISRIRSVVYLAWWLLLLEDGSGPGCYESASAERHHRRPRFR